MTIHPLRFAATAVALLALGTALSAQGMGPGHGRGHGFGFGEGRGLRSLHLSEAQQAQVKAIHAQHQATVQARLAAANAARKAMHEAMAKAPTEVATLKALHERASAAQFELMLEHRAIRQEIQSLLSEEQKASFEKLPMGPGHPGGPGFGGGHPGPRHPGQ